MRLEQLYYLLEIADTGSFSAASEKLHIAQPSISQSIASLEKELNVTLLNRSRSGAQPTEIGQKIIIHARNIANEIDKIKRFSGLNYTIGAIPAMCSVLLPRIVPIYKNRFPNIKLNILESGSKKIQMGILKNEIDLGLVSRHYDDTYDETAFKFKVLFNAHLVAYVGNQSPLSKKKSITYKDIISYPCILYEGEYILHKVIYNNLSKYGEPNILFTTRSPESTKKIVMNTAAVGFGPDISLYGDIYVDKGAIIPIKIEGENTDIEMGILIKNDKTLGVVIDSLIEDLITQSNLLQRIHNID